MNKLKKLIIATIPILLLASLLIPIPASAASNVYVVDKIGDGTWSDNTWQIDIYPGETKSTTLTLRNPSSDSLAVWISIMPSLLDNGNLVFELNKHYFVIPGKKYDEVTLRVVANNSAMPGNYSAELKIKSEIPSSIPSPGGGGGGDKCYLNVDMLGSITKARMSCTTDKTLESIVASDKDNTCFLEIDSYTKIICENVNEAPAGLVMRLVEEPPPMPNSSVIIGSAYNLTGNYRTSACGQPKYQCSGITFSKDVTLTLGYNSDSLPEKISNLTISYYDGSNWIELVSTVDYVSNTITTSISHIISSMFAITGFITPPVPIFSISTLAIAPDQPMPNESVIICAFASNTGEVVGDYPVVLEINGIKETEKIVSIAPGERQLVCFNVTREDAREYVVCVNGLCDVFFVVSPSPASWFIMYGFWLIAIPIIVILTIVLFIRKKRKYERE